MKNLRAGNCAQVGHFMLRNNQCSPVKTTEYVKGVFVSPEYYLDIDSLLKTPVSKKEALLYGRSLHMMLPTKKQMKLIEQHLETINNSLLSIGRSDCLLFGAILQQFWTRFAKTETRSAERRGVLFLVPV